MQSTACWKKFAAATVVILALFSACVSAPEKPPTIEEQLREDIRVGNDLVDRFEPLVKLKQDMEISVFLRKMATKLADRTALQEAPIGVFMVQDRDSRWRNYSLPGNRIYLSLSLVKGLAFENELAAALALELGNIFRRNTLKRIQQQLSGPGVSQQAIGENDLERLLGPNAANPPSIEYFGPSGIFAYNEEQSIEAAQSAVDMMYGAGYDPRGLVALFERYKKNPTHSPIESTYLDPILDSVRHMIAGMSPLRNPIVRSPAFIAIRKRIEKL